MADNLHSYIVINTPIGEMLAEFQSEFLTKLHFITENEKIDINRDFSIPNESGKQLQSELNMYFNGQHQQFDIPLKPEGTDFQKKIWALLEQIPFGKTISYKEQSVAYGNKLAIRAIAAANSKNPIAIILPCHRVVGSNGSLTGYRGGIDKKKYLLELEGYKRFQKSLFE